MQSNFSKHIQSFSAEVRGNFFMPGHKGKISPLDVTEFPDTGDLTYSSGVFAEAEQNLARIFGAERSHILVNGATVGNFAMIMATCQAGDKLIVDSLCHRSIPNALNLFGVKPVYVDRNIHLNSSIHGGINSYDIQQALKKDKKIKGAIITSPTYHGICSDIRGIAETLHNAGKFLLVDEAHGAHFYFSENLPQTAMEQGADMCVVSAHKTLPAPGQTAILNVGKSFADNPRIKECINILQTSSPSFMLISQMLDGISQMSELSEHYEKLIAACEDFARAINENTRATCVTWSHMDNCHVVQKDQTRLVISLSRAGLNGKAAFDLLWERYKIRPEMHDDNNIVCIVTVCNSLDDLHNLYNAIAEICGRR
jgi:arginine/lysine/ornithine decarboxylase